MRTTRTSDWVRLASADDALDEAIETIDRELEVPARTGETARRPDDHSRRRPGRMTKMGDRYLRTVLVQAPAVPLATTKGII